MSPSNSPPNLATTSGWFLQNIVQRICSHSDDPTLLSLSRTSRALSHPALRYIWYSLPSFAPLFLTLPEDALKWVEDNHGYTKIEVTRELFDEDLARYRYYAPLIHYISAMSIPHYDAALGAWEALERAGPGPLPNLREVDLFVGLRLQDFMSPPFYFLLGRGLRSVQLRLIHVRGWPLHPDPGLNRLLASLPQSSPQASTFILEASPRSLYAADEVSQAVLRLSNLVHLTVIGIPLAPRVLTHLCSLPRLNNFKFRAQSDDYPEAVTSELVPPGCNPLSVLVHLTIDSDSAQCVTRLLLVLQPPELSSLKIELSNRPPIDDLPALSSAVAALPCKSLLRELAFGFPGSPYAPAVHGTALPHAILAPLQTIPNIHTFRLYGDYYAAVKDDELAEMAHAWPCLRVFLLCDQAAGPAHATLAGLLDLARHCTDLEELHVPLADITRAECEAILSRAPDPGFDCATLEPVARCEVWRLGVGRAAIEERDVPAFAAVLSMVFPRVERVQHCWRQPLFTGEEDVEAQVAQEAQVEAMRGRYFDVMDAVPALVSVRREEQRYAIRTLYNAGRVS